jgi:hypothetical protein
MSDKGPPTHPQHTLVLPGGRLVPPMLFAALQESRIGRREMLRRRIILIGFGVKRTSPNSVPGCPSRE